MEFNIALNTVVYLMIFLFPGIIFRKFLFIREYSKEFDKGNLFERFIWTLFTSLIILCVTFFIFTFIQKVLLIDLLPSISYETIRNTFIELSNNQLPDPGKDINVNAVKVKINDLYKDFFFLVFAIYSLSCGFGLVAYYITSSNVIKATGVLKYLNYWQDLVKGTFNLKKDDTLTYGYTNADVLTECGDTTKLYSGRINNYFLDPQSNQLQTIVLSDTKRYSFDQSTGNHVLKDVPGDNFIIEKEKILNMNFTYIYESKDENRFFKRFKIVIDIIFSLLFLFLIASMFFSAINIYTSTVFRKFVFFICGLLSILALNQNAKVILTGQWSKLKFSDVFFIIFVLLPFVWIFNVMNWYWVLAIDFGVLLVISIGYREQVEKEANTNKYTTISNGEITKPTNDFDN